MEKLKLVIGILLLCCLSILPILVYSQEVSIKKFRDGYGYKIYLMQDGEVKDSIVTNTRDCYFKDNNIVVLRSFIAAKPNSVRYHLELYKLNQTHFERVKTAVISISRGSGNTAPLKFNPEVFNIQLTGSKIAWKYENHFSKKRTFKIKDLNIENWLSHICEDLNKIENFTGFYECKISTTQ